MWVPGHAGMHGNELADQAANSELDITTDQCETYAALDPLK
jgi:ribonuclease HI